MTKENQKSLELEDEEELEDYKFDQAGYDAYMNEEDDEGDFAYELAPYTRRQLATSGLGGQLSKLVEKYIKLKKLPEAEKFSIEELNVLNSEIELRVSEFDSEIFDQAVEYRENIKIYAKYKKSLEDLVINKVLIEKDDEFEIGSKNEPEPAYAVEAKNKANDLFQTLTKFEDMRKVDNLKRRTILAKIGALATLDSSSHYEKMLEAIDKKIFGIDNVYEITKEKITEEDEAAFLDSIESLSSLTDEGFSIDSMSRNEEYALANHEYSIDEIFTMELNKALAEHDDEKHGLDSFRDRAVAYQKAKLAHPSNVLVAKEPLLKDETLNIFKVLEMINDNTIEHKAEPLIYLDLCEKYGVTPEL